MKKLISLAAAASLALTAVPALARQMDDTGMSKEMRVEQKIERKTVKIMENTKKKIEKMAQRVSRRSLKNTPKKLTPSQACKDVWGKDRAACMRAFNMGKKWVASSSSSSMSSSSSVINGSSVSSSSSSWMSSSSSMSSSSMSSSSSSVSSN